MDQDLQELEDSLKGLRPKAPDAACLERLLAAVEGRLQKNDLSISGVESLLASMQPVPTSSAVFERMLETVSQVPFPMDGKVVLFPGAAKPAAAKAASRRPWYAAAAAVAVAGAFSALMIDGRSGQGGRPVRVASGSSVDLPITSSAAPGNFISASRNSGLRTATDQGVSWTPDKKPVRVVRVEYTDRTKLTNEEGKVIEVETPRVEFYMVPEKID